MVCSLQGVDSTYCWDRLVVVEPVDVISSTEEGFATSEDPTAGGVKLHSLDA